MAFSDHTTLLGQPIEVRYKIYSLLLESDSNIKPEYDETFNKPNEYRNLQSMRLVCQAMNKDAKVIFFGQNTFEFASEAMMAIWLLEIGRSIHYVKRIFIQMPKHTYVHWRRILMYLGRKATNLQVLQLWVFGLISSNTGRFVRHNTTARLGPLLRFSTVFGVDDLVQLISQINSLRIIKLVGEIDKSFMDDICLSTACEVQALRSPSDFATWDNRDFEVWRAV